MKNPPKRSLRFLRWYCRDDCIEEIEGNLIELFDKTAEVNPGKAHRSFMWQVLRHFRLDFIKPISWFNLEYTFTMLRSYFKIAVRNLSSSPSFTFIHIAGLSIGVATCVLLFQYVNFERSYDQFHTNADRIYRVPIEYSEGFGSFRKTASNHPGLGPAMKQDFPQVQSYTRLVHPSNFGGNLTLKTYDENGQVISYLEEKGFLADSTFLEIFSFPLVDGDPLTALDDPTSIVISKSTAIKYFGTAFAVGERLQTSFSNDKEMVVSAVLDDLPKNSHLDFDILVPFHALFSNIGENNRWVWPEFHTYVLLGDAADAAAIEAQFPAFRDRYMADIHKEWDFMTYFSMQPLTDIHLYSDQANEITPPGSQRMVYFLTILGIFTLLVAWLNYINLSTSRSLEKAKEVGVRKTIGARRSQLLAQFLTESTMVCTVSVIIGLFIAKFATPGFESLVGKSMGPSLLNSSLLLNPIFWIVFIGTILIGGFLAGIYPALILSSFKPMAVLKGIQQKKASGLSLRNFLVGFQFTISLLLIAATILVTAQMKFMNNQDLGYTEDQILVVRAPIPRDSLTYHTALGLPSELERLPFVTELTQSLDIPGRHISLRGEVRKLGLGNDQNVGNFMYRVDHKFLDTYDIPVVAGRNFDEVDSSRIYDAPNNKIVISNQLANDLGYSDANAAVGQVVEFKLGQNFHRGEILGVTANFHQRSLKEAYQPLLFYYPKWPNARFYSIRTNNSNWSDNINTIKKTFEKVYPFASFDFFFQDEYFDQQYRAEQQFSKVCKVMAGLAIFITCLGFLGLSALTVLRRSKEIGVRRILGASLQNILQLLGRDFVIMLGIASLIAFPAVIHFGQQWLNNFAFAVNWQWQIFVLPIVCLLILILGIITLQIHRTAALDPVESLRED